MRLWLSNLQRRTFREDETLSTPTDHSLREGTQLLETARDATVRVARAWFLRFLRWGGGASNKILVGVLFEEVGLRLSHATMDECAAWLADQGYVRIEVFEIATAYRLTRLGDDVARGIVVDPGVEPIRLCDVEADETVIGGLRAR